MKLCILEGKGGSRSTAEREIVLYEEAVSVFRNLQVFRKL